MVRRVLAQANATTWRTYSSRRAIPRALAAAVFSWLVLLPLVGSTQSSESAVAKIAREQLPTVVTLVALDKYDQPLALGSGFFISRSGAIATNAHVVEGASRVVVRWRGQSGTAIRILNFDPRYDLIILQTSFPSSPAVPLGDSELVTVGQDIVVLGSPYGLEGTVSAGILSGVRGSGDVKLLQITAPISPGSSGGPVFDLDGRVIGVATSAFAKGQNLNFALPANLLRRLPPSALRFSEAKHFSPESSQTQNMRELVFPNNIIENYASLSSALVSLTVSLQNQTNDTIGGFRILVVVKNHKGEVLDFHLTELQDTVIPPKLAKQVHLHAFAEGFTGWDGSKAVKGSYDIRILDFKIVRRGGGTVEDLLERQ